MPKEVTLALLQEKNQQTRKQNFDRTVSKIEDAASKGAQIICTQELFLSPYFCQAEDSSCFELAEVVDDRNEVVVELSQISKKHEVVMIASLFEKFKDKYFNTTVVVDADGRYLGKYRKMHIPEDPQFHEKYYFSEGDMGPRVFETKYAKIGVLICWDQWFPEAARMTALQGAEIIFYPTAIGYLANEKEKVGEKYDYAWVTIQQSHAVANCLFVASVNRIGRENHPTDSSKWIDFWGQSFVANPYGELIAFAEGEEETLIAKIDLDEGQEMRKTWPFYRDRRVDIYENLLKK